MELLNVKFVVLNTFVLPSLAIVVVIVVVVVVAVVVLVVVVSSLTLMVRLFLALLKVPPNEFLNL